MALSAEDINSIDYFWRYQRDLPNWTGWEACLSKLKTDWPELLTAFEAYNAAMAQAEAAARVVTAVIKAKAQDY